MQRMNKKIGEKKDEKINRWIEEWMNEWMSELPLDKLEFPRVGVGSASRNWIYEEK